MSACSTDLCIFAGGFCTLKSITVIIVTVVGVALLYRYRGRLNENSPYAFYGLIGIVLLVGGTAAVSVSITPTTDCPPPAHPGISVHQDSGTVDITVVYVGNRVDSMEIIDPNGTRSTETRTTTPNLVPEKTIPLQSGTRITLRSNEEVINFLNDPENNIAVPTASGTKTVESVGELPSEYQRAPDGFIDPEADIGNYDNASVATVACLYTVPSFELGERSIPAGTSIPCSTPMLAQNDIEDDYLGTHMKPSSGSNGKKTLTSPVTLKKGEYQLIGTIRGHETVVKSFKVTGEQMNKNETATEGRE